MLLLKQESNLHIDLVALDVAILYKDVLILNPRAFDASKRLGSTGYGLVYGLLETRFGCGAQLCYSGNTHTYLCASLEPDLPGLVASLIHDLVGRTPNIKAGTPRRMPGLLATYAAIDR